MGNEAREEIRTQKVKVLVFVVSFDWMGRGERKGTGGRREYLYSKIIPQPWNLDFASLPQQGVW